MVINNQSYLHFNLFWIYMIFHMWTLTFVKKIPFYKGFFHILATPLFILTTPPILVFFTCIFSLIWYFFTNIYHLLTIIFWIYFLKKLKFTGNIKLHQYFQTSLFLQHMLYPTRYAPSEMIERQFKWSSLGRPNKKISWWMSMTLASRLDVTIFS